MQTRLHLPLAFHIINKNSFMISPFQAKVVHHPFPDRHGPLSRQVYLNLFPDLNYNEAHPRSRQTLKIRPLLSAHPYLCLYSECDPSPARTPPHPPPPPPHTHTPLSRDVTTIETSSIQIIRRIWHAQTMQSRQIVRPIYFFFWRAALMDWTSPLRNLVSDFPWTFDFCVIIKIKL